MASHTPNKHLRVGIFKGKEQLCGNVVKTNQSITIGQNQTCTFKVSPDDLPDTVELFTYDENKGTYTLRVKKGTKGRIEIQNGKTIAIEQLSKSEQNIRIFNGKVHIDLPDTARGKVSLGKITVLFQFVNVKTDAGTLLMSQKQHLRITDIVSLGFLIPLIFSFVLHIGFLTFVLVQDWPRDDEAIADLTRFIRQAEPKASIETEEEKDKPEEEEIIEDPTGEPSDYIEDVPDMGDSGASNDELMERITDAHREMGAAITAQILGIDGGDAGDYFGAMLGSSAAIADMSDVSAGDIGLAGTGGLLNSLANTTGGSGNGLLGIGNGEGGNGGPRVVAGNDAKKNVERKKVDFGVSQSGEFTASAPKNAQESINAVFKKKNNDIRNCYSRVMNAQGKVAGRLVVLISADKNGTVIRVDVKEDQIGGELFSCVRGRIMNWKFGPLPAPLTFKRTWVFD